MPGIRDRHIVPRALQRRSLRFPLALPILIPTVALAGLWGYAANGLVEEGLGLRAGADVASTVGKPAHTLVARLQEERRLTSAWQAASTKSSRTALKNARSDTDSAVADFRKSRGGLDSADTAVRSKAESLDDALGRLSEQRSSINARKVNATQTFRYYTDTTAETTDLLSTAVRMDDGGLARNATAMTSLVQFSEILSREDALLSGARPEPAVVLDGPPDTSARGEFSQYLSLQRQSRVALDADDLPAETADAYKRLTGTPQWDSLVQAEDTVESRNKPLARQTDTWQESAGVVGKELRQVSSDSLNGVVKGGTDRAQALLLGAAVGSVLALAVLAASIVLAIRFARSLTNRLSRLHRATGEWADSTFPQLVEELGQDERSEPQLQQSQGDYGSDEVAALARAIERQWQTVVETTVQQARGREGSETVFLGLARRTQVLVNRMIPKLDKLEREHEDSKLLKDIFAVDHLATRVRRHTENLLILGGALPGRRWSKAVPIYEVLRSAISETEEYSRVEALPAPPVSLVGQAVADVVHLLAELIENGTSFSPPDTRVCVSAEKVARGLALEVVDRGLGMPAEQYDELNKLLADPPKPDMLTLGEAPRLGLFVVARLANRHGLEVSLRKSAYGGSLVVVLLPSALLEETESSLLSNLVAESKLERQDLPVPDSPAELTGSDFPPALTSSSFDSADSAPSLVPAEPVGAAVGSSSGGLFGSTDSSAVPQPHLDEHGGYPAYAGAGLLPSTPGAESPMALGAASLSPGTLSVPGPGMLDSPETGLTLGSLNLGAPGSSGAGLLHPDSGGAGLHGPGLHPGPPETTAPPVEDTPSMPSPSMTSPAMPSSWPDLSLDHIGDTGYTEPAGIDVPQGEPDQQRTVGRLPIRVRGEHLAEGLRKQSQSPSEPDAPSTGASSSPDRAGATMAAIQSGSKRARAAKPAEPVGDSQAETPGHGAGAENPVRKDH
ncbi:nitrate- and nitrite sensing domain-containing protein [Streptomyces albidus (ex Kaewkla and Franco 2022)]|uniref:nitrate- and nitrite sensing domain-containing protein n=1 Tax=Streptomyces albidus (ex Kaewkla and Franco 2022) TaxID=722709 RepID=UPI0015EFDAB0|nr:nitrate- and nitrite sensing domain-containing protein [Streptomyces albidus (ex Kaewkla and Franco 2022)]